MNSPDAIAILRRSERVLREWAFGMPRCSARSRGGKSSGSDVDIMVEIGPEARITVFDYVELKEYIANLFDGPVDVVNREGLKSYVAPAATADALYAF